MARTLGVHHIINKAYPSLAFEGEWKEVFGCPSDPFTMLVYGLPKNGKTNFMMKFSKYLTQFGKVWYNSIEEGDCLTIKEAFIRCRMDELEPGKFMMGDRYFFQDMVEYLKGRNKGKFVIIDSRDFINLTCQQFKKLKTLFPVVICFQ